MLFEGRAALVTGGGSGIGRAICLRLAREGAQVASVDINPEAARQVADESGGIGIGADVASEDQVNTAVERTASQFGRLDFLVNCAGNAAFAPVVELSLTDWQAVIDVHLTGAFLCSRAAIDHLLKAKGRIVSVSSNYGFKGRAGGANYSAAKAGIVGLTKVLAHELAPDVTVNAIAPGPTDTPRWRRSMEDGGAAFEAKRVQRLRDIPLGRLGEPDDIAGGVAFLLGPDASWITGSVLHVNGGEFML